MDKMKTIPMFTIEHRQFVGKERKELTTILSCWPEDYEARGELNKILEDQFGWNLTEYTVRAEKDGGRVTVKKNEEDGDYHVYTIKEALLLVRDTEL